MVFPLRIRSFTELARWGTRWYVNAVILVLSLIVPLDDVDTFTVPDHVSEGLHPDGSVQPGVVADENKPNRITSELLCGVRDSAGASGPLKSVAGCLCFILDSCEVWSPSRASDSKCLRSF